MTSPTRLACVREAVRMADAVAGRMREAGLAGRTITLKVRFGDFATITRSHTVADAVDDGPTIAEIAALLLDAVDVGGGVRLLGVRVANLTDTAVRQLSFDDAGGGGRGASSAAIDADQAPIRLRRRRPRRRGR